MTLAVGVSGQIAAGKTTASETLEIFGFAYTRISWVIDDVLRARGEEPSREAHQRVGMELHQNKGQAWLCDQALAKLPIESPALVLDGLRWPDDVVYMRERFASNFVHIHVSALEELRRSRFAAANKQIPYEEVLRHPVEQEVEKLAALAELRLDNNGAKADFQIDVLGSVLKRQIDAS